MAVAVDMEIIGDPSLRTEVIAVVEHLFADRAGEWRVSITGSRLSDEWPMKVTGPDEFERSYILEGSEGEHEPAVIRRILGRMLPK